MVNLKQQWIDCWYFADTSYNPGVFGVFIGLAQHIACSLEEKLVYRIYQ